jgi:hypothetical protein
MPMRPDSQHLAKLREKIQLRAHAWSAMHAYVSRGEHSSSLKENPRSSCLQAQAKPMKSFRLPRLAPIPSVTIRT